MSKNIVYIMILYILFLLFYSCDIETGIFKHLSDTDSVSQSVSISSYSGTQSSINSSMSSSSSLSSSSISSSSSSITPLFVEDFENGDLTINGWTIGTYHSTAYEDKGDPASNAPPSFTGSISPDGNQCLFINHNSDNASDCAIQKTFNNIQPNYISYYIAIPFDGYYSGNMALYDGSYLIAEIFFYYSTDDICLNDNKNTILGNAYAQWYYIELQNFDWSLKTFDLYIDGTNYGSFGFNDPSAASLNLIKFWNQSNWAQSYIDDIYME